LFTTPKGHKGKKMKYKLDVKNDIDVDGSGEDITYLLNLQYGFRFSDDIVHVRGYGSMKELRESIKNEVIPCDCPDCQRGLQKKT